MKIGTQKDSAASVLLVTMATIVVIGFAITSYLSLVFNQNRTVARSSAWKQTMAISEGGIEEALTQLHYNGNGNMTSNSWTLGGDGLYHKTRTFSDGSYYSVSVTATNPATIVSTGFVVIPFSGTSPTQYVSRRVMVKTQPPAMGGINAKGVITLSGGGYIDSYNSTDPHLSTNGLYLLALRSDKAKVLTDSGVAGAIAVGTGKIYGTAVTGATGTVTYGSHGAVGDIAWNLLNSGGETGHIANNANVQFNDVPAPFPAGTGLAPNTGTGGSGVTYLGTNYTYQLGAGNYSMTPGINISGHNSILVTGNPTVLYVDGSFSTSGNGYIYIAPNASLKLYVNGTASFSGGAIVNTTGLTTNCYVYGMTNCTSITYSGGSAFYGIIYTPDADFTDSGNADFCGSLTAKTVKISGGGNIHYDEALSGNSQVVLSWNEF